MLTRPEQVVKRLIHERFEMKKFLIYAEAAIDCLVYALLLALFIAVTNSPIAITLGVVIFIAICFCKIKLAKEAFK